MVHCYYFKVTFVNKELNETVLENMKRDYGTEKFDFVFLNRTKHNQPSHVPVLKLLEGDLDKVRDTFSIPG